MIAESKTSEAGGPQVGWKHLEGLEVLSGVTDLAPVETASPLVLMSDPPNLASV